ncbi:hypothetical protein DSECCO2_606540 [anaerobic digester metagenome]
MELDREIRHHDTIPKHRQFAIGHGIKYFIGSLAIEIDRCCRDGILPFVNRIQFPGKTYAKGHAVRALANVYDFQGYSTIVTLCSGQPGEVIVSSIAKVIVMTLTEAIQRAAIFVIVHIGYIKMLDAISFFEVHPLVPMLGIDAVLVEISSEVLGDNHLVDVPDQ